MPHGRDTISREDTTSAPPGLEGGESVHTHAIDMAPPGTESGSDPAVGNATEGAEVSLSAVEEHPLREMIRVAAPSVVTMTSYTVMQFIDKLMVKAIGPEPVYVAASGNGGITAWTLMALMLGFTSVVNTFVSQNYGAGKPRDGVGYVWTGLWMMIASWVVIMIPAAIVMPWYFGLFSTHSEQLRGLETTYAMILIAGSVFTMMGRTLAQFFYGIHRPNVVMVAAITGNLVNAGLNYVLIFGELGFPKLGIAGAAIATVCGGAVELSIPAAIFLGRKYAREFATRARWRPSLEKLRDIARLGWPAGAMWINEILCWNILMTVLIGHFGELHNTAGWIALGYMHLSFMPAVGMSIAMTAIVGKCIGAKRPDLATARTWLGLKITLAYMGVCAVLFVVFREPAIALFIDAETSPEDRAELIRIGSFVMIAAAVFQLFDALGITLSGALRGAGDTVWPGVVTIVNSWVTIVGLGFVAITFFEDLGSIGPWIGASLYIVVLGVAFLARFLGGKWKTMGVVRDDKNT